MSRRRLAALLLAPWLLTGCVTAYKAATEERSLSVFVEDNVITARIKKAFLDAAPQALALSVFCHRGRVVLAGVVADPRLGERAVALARAVEGVRSVETYFLPAQPAPLRDLELAARIKARLVGDLTLRVTQVDMVVVAGHAVLTGVVDGPDRVDRIVRHARAVEGVLAVKSFLQLK